MRFLSFSAEATTPAGGLLMNLINPIKNLFYESFHNKTYTPDLDEIFIVFVCISNEMHIDGKIYKDRKYISRKNRYADIRLNLNYEEFINSQRTQRIHLIWNTIIEAITIVSQRVPSINKDELINDIKFCFESVYCSN